MVEKKVDESWKNKSETEQETLIKQQPEPEQMPPVDFGLFVSSLGMQALMALGEIENPQTNAKEKNLPQAKYLIDIVELLQNKTKGNLTPEEDKMLEQILYELRMKYISLQK